MTLSLDPKKAIPHREPFLLVSELIECSNDGLTGTTVYNVPKDLEVFKGHFPGNPVFPGVMQIEVAAQACLWVFMYPSKPGRPDAEVLFRGIDSFKFKNIIRPGDQIVSKVANKQIRKTFHIWEVVNSVNDKVVGQGSYTMMMANTQEVLKYRV